MHIDCTTCPVRGSRCDDCMVTAMLTLSPAAPSPPTEPRASGPPADDALLLDAVEHRAVGALLDAGLITEDEALSASARRESRDAWARVG